MIRIGRRYRLDDGRGRASELAGRMDEVRSCFVWAVLCLLRRGWKCQQNSTRLVLSHLYGHGARPGLRVADGLGEIGWRTELSSHSDSQNAKSVTNTLRQRGVDPPLDRICDGSKSPSARRHGALLCWPMVQDPDTDASSRMEGCKNKQRRACRTTSEE